MTEKLLPCPFCGRDPQKELGKIEHCSLHGDKSQTMVLRCKGSDCPANPRVEAGNIYNGGRGKALQAAATLWNTRIPAGETP